MQNSQPPLRTGWGLGRMAASSMGWLDCPLLTVPATHWALTRQSVRARGERLWGMVGKNKGQVVILKYLVQKTSIRG